MTSGEWMSGYALDATFEMIGGFWDACDPERRFTGSLKSSKGRVQIISSPEHRSLNPGEVRDAFKSAFSEAPIRHYTAICGFTREKACTLLQVKAGPDADGVIDFPTAQVLSAELYKAGQAVMGLHLNSEAEPLDSAAFYYTKIHHLLPTPWTLAWAEDKQTIEAPLRAVEVFRFCSLPLRAEIICEVFAQGKLKVKKGSVIKSVPRIRVIPLEKHPVRWYISLAFRIENLFTLLMGTSVSLKRLQVFRGEESGWVVQHRLKRPQKIERSAWVRSSHSRTAMALSNWLGVGADKLPIENTVLGTLRRTKLFAETEFLTLAQALEGFGRITFDDLCDQEGFRIGLDSVKRQIAIAFGESLVAKRCAELLINANEPSYGVRLGQICDLLTPELAVRLVGDRANFIRRVVQTRNFYTHLGSRGGTSAVTDAGELFLLNRRISALIRCVMLLEFGLDEEEVGEGVVYQANRWKII